MSQQAQSPSLPALAFDTWPGMDLTYHYASGPQLLLTFTLDTSRYNPTADTMWQEQAARDAMAYRELLDQYSILVDGAQEALSQLHLYSTLHPDMPVAFRAEDHSALCAYLQLIVTYLEAIVAEEKPQDLDSLVLSWPVEKETLARLPMLELLVMLQMLETGSEETVDDSVEIQDCKWEFPVLPATDATAGDRGARWRLFAENFAEAFPGDENELLLPAVGAIPEGETGEEASGIWVLRMGSDKQQHIWFDVADPMPALMLPPWAQHPIGGSVLLPKYVSGVGLSVGQETKHYSNVDLNAWADSFLVSLDTQCATEAGVRLREIREQLAEKFSKGLEVIEAGAVPSDGQLKRASETAQQRLSERISWAGGAVVSYPVSGGGAAAGSGVMWLAGTLHFDQDAQANEETQPVRFRLQSASDTDYIAALLAPTTGRHSWRSFSSELQIGHVGREVKAPDGTVTISWLRLLSENPTSTPVHRVLPENNVQLPLRRCPDVAVLHQQEAHGLTDPKSLADALSWNYALSYQHQNALQDQYCFALELNVPVDDRINTVTGRTPFFDSLAAFISCRFPIEQDLLEASGDGAESGEQQATARLALAAYEQLAKAVADAWPAPVSGAEPSGKLDMPLSYSLVESAANDGTLQIAIQQPIGAPAIQVHIPGYTSEAIAGCEKGWRYKNESGPLTADNALGMSRTVEWKGLHALTQRNATASMQLLRNAELGGHAINPAFITSTVRAQSEKPIAPMLAISYAMDAASWMEGAGPWPLSAILNSLFKALFPAHLLHQQLRLACNFIFPLKGTQDIESELPVLLSSYLFERDKDFAPATGCGDDAQGFVCSLANQLQAWLATTAPDTSSARFVFDLTLFADANPVSNPLVHFRDLRIPIAQISKG